jgi:mycoredoxin
MTNRKSPGHPGLGPDERQPSLEPIIVYGARWGPDCWRVKSFLKQRGVEFEEVDIETDSSAEEIVIRAIKEGAGYPH